MAMETQTFAFNTLRLLKLSVTQYGLLDDTIGNNMKFMDKSLSGKEYT